MNSAARVILLLAAGYAAIMLLLLVFQHRLVYFPLQGGYDATPQARGLAFERVSVQADDGVQLAAWWIPAPGANAARGTVLVFHGNAGNMQHRIDYALMFGGMGYNTLLMDYRGYGESSGAPSEAGTYRDAAACWTWLTAVRGIPPPEIVLFGESMGGGVATWLARRERPRALILASTFTSVPDLGAEIYPWLPVRWISRIHYNNLANLRDVGVPILIAHSPADDIIPYAHARRLYDAAHAPKSFLELGGGHNEGFVFARAEWAGAVQRFLDAASRK